jgi:hypothetical protein
MHEVTSLAEPVPIGSTFTPAAASGLESYRGFQSIVSSAPVPKWSRSTTGILTEPLCRSHGLHHRGLQPQQSVPRTPFSSLEAVAFVLELDELSEEVRARLRCGPRCRCRTAKVWGVAVWGFVGTLLHSHTLKRTAGIRLRCEQCLRWKRY